MNPTLVILAAGLGSRYGGLKQIDGLGPNGEILLEYSIYDALKAGFDAVTLIIRAEHEPLFQQQLRHAARHITINYAYQSVEVEVVKEGVILEMAPRTKPWGTGQAMLSVDHLKVPFAAINADDYYGPHSYQVMTHFLQGANPKLPNFALVGYLLQDTLSTHGHVSRAILDVDRSGFLQHIVEHTRIQPQDGQIISYEPTPQTLPSQSLASLNFWGFTPALFDSLQEQFVQHVELNGHNSKSEFFLPSAVNDLVKHETASVKVLPAEGNWMGMTYAKDSKTVSNQISDLIKAGFYPQQLWA